jgi:D-alanine-D-alanine ligase
MMKKLTVALLAGGISSEREVSLKGGQAVYDALDKDRYDVLRYDPKSDLPLLVADAGRIDFALIILHGPFGEDGTVQGLLKLLGIPYQGADVLGSSLAMNKLASKRLYEAAGLPIPPYCVLQKGQDPKENPCVRELGESLVVKPVQGGSSIGISIIHSREDLPGAVEKAFEFDSQVLVEQYIEGVELTGGVIGNRHPEPMPIIEIIPEEGHAFFDYEAKYIPGRTREICPARIDPEATRTAQEFAVRAHDVLFCRGYSRTDMIMRGKEIFVFETNTIPGMTETSLLPQAAEEAGMSFSQLLDRLIELGLEKQGSSPKEMADE